MEPLTGARDDLVDIVRSAVSGYTATQHLSPNHVIDFDPEDPDRAICHSSMYAQHHLERSGLQLAHAGGPVRRSPDVVTGALEDLLHGVPERDVIFDQQDPAHEGRAGARGRVNLKTAPTPFGDSSSATEPA